MTSAEIQFRRNINVRYSGISGGEMVKVLKHTEECVGALVS